MEKPNRYKTYYYRDEVNDDFAKLKITPDHINDNYKYITGKSKFYWFMSQVFRACVCWPILFPVAKLVYGTKIENKKAFKKVKGQGYFLYSNHTTALDPIHHSVLCNPFAFTCIICSIETFSIKGLGGIIHYVGGIPIPLSPKMYRNFSNALKFHMDHHHKVLIYPEAHIWPYYTGIRDFKSVSFRYPVELNAPVMVATTTFRKRKFFKKPGVTIHIDGPIYPNKELKFKEQIEDLRNKTYQTMKSHADQKDNYETAKYIKIID